MAAPFEARCRLNSRLGAHPKMQPPFPIPSGTPPRKPQKKNQSFSIETIFVVMIAMNLMPRGEAVDAAHARNAALFRLSVTLIGVNGLVATYLVKRKRAAETSLDGASGASLSPASSASGPVNPWDSAAAWEGMALSYAMTRQSALRTEKVTLRRHPTILLSLFIAAALPAFLTASANWNRLGTTALIGRTSLVFLGCIAVLAALSVALFFIRFPRADSTRPCVTYFSKDGIQDVTPDKTTEFGWSTVARIVEDEGDVLFLPKPGQTTGCLIPREAFSSIDAARRFHQTALALWQSKGTAPIPQEALREFGPRAAEPAMTAPRATGAAAFDLSAD